MGAFLARERRLRGIRLEEVERFTRLPRRSLERLEAGAFDGAPDGFSRGFVRTVAGAIGVDPEEAVARMLDEPEPTPAAPRPAAGRGASWLAGLLALVLGAAVLGAGLALRGWSAGGDAAPAPTRVRRDHVRSLAVSEGLAPPRSGREAPEGAEPAPRLAEGLLE